LPQTNSIAVNTAAHVLYGDETQVCITLFTKRASILLKHGMEKISPNDMRQTQGDLVRSRFNDDAVAELAADFQGQLLRASDPGYDEARRAWNGMVDKYPGLIARCIGTADVIAAVKFARKHDVLISVKGGGHSIPGHCVCDGGLMIDLSLMKGVWVDAKSRVARAQGGLTWGEFDRETQLHGLAVTGGQVSTTGIAGLTLGGGIGWLMRKHGLTCDNLLSVEMVLADGSLVRASEAENADLFWGIRGGGGNFGIVTTFEYRVHPVGPEILAGTLVYSLDKAKQVMQRCRDFMLQAPDELTTCCVLLTVPQGHPVFPEHLHGRPVLTLTVCYTGPIVDGEAVVRPLRELIKPDIDLIGKTTYVSLQKSLDITAPSGQNYWERSEYLRGVSDEAIDCILEHFTAPDAVPGEVIVFERGGVVSRVAEDAMAFAHRDANYLLWIISHWQKGEQGDRFIAWTRKFSEAMKPFTSGGVYVNGLADEGHNRVKAAYGPKKYERLVALKDKYDPTNFFSLNQNVKPSGAER
jgi:FAD/FMN-containing dehydrogenase